LDGRRRVLRDVRSRGWEDARGRGLVRGGWCVWGAEGSSGVVDGVEVAILVEVDVAIALELELVVGREAWSRDAQDLGSSRGRGAFRAWCQTSSRGEVQT
jgi:hypothetical protein